MPQNRNALIRYRCLDSCLRQRGREWTKAELIEACTEALRKISPREESLGARTFDRDIQTMRRVYHAPIEVLRNKYYTYSDKDFSITNSPLDLEDLQSLYQSLSIIRLFEGFAQGEALADIIGRIEQKLSYGNAQVGQVIGFEAVGIQRGQEFLAEVYEAILGKRPLRATYQSFKWSEAATRDFSPYYLKAYNGRWYLLGFNHEWRGLSILALDRIEKLTPSYLPFEANRFGPPERYFEDIIGVSRPEEGRAIEVLLRISEKQLPYLRTRPLHPSQKILEDKRLVSLQVIPNYELKSKILGLGADVEVLEPGSLRQEIADTLAAASRQYTPYT